MHAQQLHTLVESVVGPVTYDSTPGTDYTWYRGQHRGTAIWFSVSQTPRSAAALRLAASLQHRPLCLWVHRRDRAAYTAAPPEVTTGDPRFDQAWEIHGYPAEVIQRVLDEPTRGMILARNPNERLVTEAGCLRALRHPPSQGLTFDLPADVIRPWLDELVSLTSRLVSAFDEHHAALSQHHGASAAQAWVEQVRALEQRTMASRAEGRRQLRGMLVLIIAIPLVGTLIVTAIVLVSYLF